MLALWITSGLWPMSSEQILTGLDLGWDGGGGGGGGG